MSLIFTSPKNKNYFFGYYDKSQLNKDNDKLLSLETNFIDRIPDIEDEANIGYFEINTSGRNKLYLLCS